MDQETEILSKTLLGEAEGEGEKGMEMVASVILDRAKSHVDWWGSSIEAVCLSPYQFSCWNPGPRKDFIDNVSNDYGPYQLAQMVAAKAIAGQITDNTGNADSYFATTIQPPSWADPYKHTVTYLHHSFYRLYLPAPNISVHTTEAQVQQAAAFLKDKLQAAQNAIQTLDKDSGNGY